VTSVPHERVEERLLRRLLLLGGVGALVAVLVLAIAVFLVPRHHRESWVHFERRRDAAATQLSAATKPLVTGGSSGRPEALSVLCRQLIPKVTGPLHVWSEAPDALARQLGREYETTVRAYLAACVNGNRSEMTFESGRYAKLFAQLQARWHTLDERARTTNSA
jgi:hypothetical protein